MSGRVFLLSACGQTPFDFVGLRVYLAGRPDEPWHTRFSRCLGSFRPAFDLALYHAGWPHPEATPGFFLGRREQMAKADLWVFAFERGTPSALISSLELGWVLRGAGPLGHRVLVLLDPGHPGHAEVESALRPHRVQFARTLPELAERVENTAKAVWAEYEAAHRAALDGILAQAAGRVRKESAPAPRTRPAHEELESEGQRAMLLMQQTAFAPLPDPAPSSGSWDSSFGGLE